MTQKLSLDTDLIRQIAEIMRDTGLSAVEYSEDQVKLTLRIEPPRETVVMAQPMAYAPAPAPAAAAAAPTGAVSAGLEPVAPAPAGHAVTSPMVGTVYLQAEPGSPPFVRAGDSVREGQTLLIIEAMKVMNPITAPRDGVVLAIHVGDGQPVEYGEPLLSLG